MDCPHCHSKQLHKNGHLPKGGQRWRCKECGKQFSTHAKKRGTYSPAFKAKVIDYYCHKGLKVKEVLTLFPVSTRTLIKRAKQHKPTCVRCSQPPGDDE